MANSLARVRTTAAFFVEIDWQACSFDRDQLQAEEFQNPDGDRAGGDSSSSVIPPQSARSWQA
jgi:hypothetical protein